MIYKDDEHEYNYRNGEPAEILTVSRNNRKYPVVSIMENGHILVHTESGEDLVSKKESPEDLILIPKHDYPIDANVWVWNKGYEGFKNKRHFSGIETKTGKPMTWADGRTKWSSSGITLVWDYCELAK